MNAAYFTSIAGFIQKWGLLLNLHTYVVLCVGMVLVWYLECMYWAKIFMNYFVVLFFLYKVTNTYVSLIYVCLNIFSLM